MPLRWYQQACLDKMLSSLETSDTVAQLPTGAGKSHIIAELIKIIAGEFGMRVAVVAHVKELLEQNRRVLHDEWPDAPSGLWCAGLGEKKPAQVVFASIQSIYKSTPDIGRYDLIIIDEAHRIPHKTTGTYRAFIAAQRESGMVRVAGLTATPYRMGTGLLHQGDGRLFDTLCYEQKIAPLVAEGWLCPLIGRHADSSVDMQGVHVRAGEFVASEESERFAVKVPPAVSEMLALTADRKSILVFASSIAHAEAICAEVAAHGVDAPALVTGQTPADERRDTVSKFRGGELRMLVNVGVYTTGFDAPNVDAIAMMRATRSAGLYVQMVGRGMRTSPGKDNCILLDYGGNIRRHGVLDEITVEAACEKPSETKPKSKRCPSCGSEVSNNATTCPHCGIRIRKESELSENLEAQADDANPMVPAEPRWLSVQLAVYTRHKKEGKPDSMKVTYYTGSMIHGERLSEWVCFEHGGYAAMKAGDWAAARGVSLPPPTVADALEYDWPQPVAVKVEKDGKWDRITDYQWE